MLTLTMSHYVKNSPADDDRLVGDVACKGTVES